MMGSITVLSQQNDSLSLLPSGLARLPKLKREKLGKQWTRRRQACKQKDRALSGLLHLLRAPSLLLLSLWLDCLKGCFAIRGMDAFCQDHGEEIQAERGPRVDELVERRA
jgi:hypothetical protein